MKQKIILPLRALRLGENKIVFLCVLALTDRVSEQMQSGLFMLDLD
jgi:hypothetical protein